MQRQMRVKYRHIIRCCTYQKDWFFPPLRDTHTSWQFVLWAIHNALRFTVHRMAQLAPWRKCFCKTQQQTGVLLNFRKKSPQIDGATCKPLYELLRPGFWRHLCRRFDESWEIRLVIHARCRLARCSVGAIRTFTAKSTTTSTWAPTTTSSSTSTPPPASRVVSKSDANISHQLLAVPMAIIILHTRNTSHN